MTQHEITFPTQQSTLLSRGMAMVSRQFVEMAFANCAAFILYGILLLIFGLRNTGTTRTLSIGDSNVAAAFFGISSLPSTNPVMYFLFMSLAMLFVALFASRGTTIRGLTGDGKFLQGFSDSTFTATFHWKLSKYCAAASKMFGSSWAWPRPLLQDEQIAPRILPVAWSWSKTSLVSRWHIAQQGALTMASYCSTVRPYLVLMRYARFLAWLCSRWVSAHLRVVSRLWRRCSSVRAATFL